MNIAGGVGRGKNPLDFLISRRRSPPDLTVMKLTVVVVDQDGHRWLERTITTTARRACRRMIIEVAEVGKVRVGSNNSSGWWEDLS